MPSPAARRRTSARPSRARTDREQVEQLRRERRERRLTVAARLTAVPPCFG